VKETLPELHEMGYGQPSKGPMKTKLGDYLLYRVDLLLARSTKINHYNKLHVNRK
jgi:hypothetical protein